MKQAPVSTKNNCERAMPFDQITMLINNNHMKITRAKPMHFQTND